MISHPKLRLLLSLIFAVLPLGAQDGYFLTVGRMLAGSPDETTWRLSVQQDMFKPIGADFSFSILPGARPRSGDLIAFGADFTFFNEHPGMPSFLAGIAAGVGTGDQKLLWAGPSIGVRVPLLSSGQFRALAEGRWRNFTFHGRNGIEIGLMVGWRKNSVTEPRPESVGFWKPASTVETLLQRGIPREKAVLLDRVVNLALEEMGQPYLWGGSGDGKGGFDCSGLIYYAYGKEAISIPRTSLGQSRAGIAIRRESSLLLPGDVLTFSERGNGEVTHVGLYVGEGRFIHSASGGVRISRLSEDDSEGRLWLRNWLGVRRIVE